MPGVGGLLGPQGQPGNTHWQLTAPSPLRRRCWVNTFIIYLTADQYLLSAEPGCVNEPEGACARSQTTLQPPAGGTATWHPTQWPGRRAGAAPAAQHPSRQAPHPPLPPSRLIQAWSAVGAHPAARPCWRHSPRWPAHTKHSNAVVQGDDNHVPVAGQDAAVYHVPRALHVRATVDIHHHWLGPAVPDVWKERRLNTGPRRWPQHPARQADQGRGQCQLPGLGRGLRSQTQSSPGGLSMDLQSRPPLNQPPGALLWVAAVAAPSPHCCPLGVSAHAGEMLAGPGYSSPAPGSGCMREPDQRHLRCRWDLQSPALGCSPMSHLWLDPSPRLRQSRKLALGGGRDGGVQDLEGRGHWWVLQRLTLPSPLPIRLGRQKPAGCLDVNPWHPSAQTQTW